MSIPSSRDQLKDWCLRQLGHPVLEVNVDDDQVDDAVDAVVYVVRSSTSITAQAILNVE